MKFKTYKRYYLMEDGTRVEKMHEITGPRTVADKNGDVFGYDIHKGIGKNKHRAFKISYTYNIHKDPYDDDFFKLIDEAEEVNLFDYYGIIPCNT